MDFDRFDLGSSYRRLQLICIRADNAQQCIVGMASELIFARLKRPGRPLCGALPAGKRLSLVAQSAELSKYNRYLWYKMRTIRTGPDKSVQRKWSTNIVQAR